MTSEQELADANYRIMLYNCDVTEFEDDLDFLVATLYQEEIKKRNTPHAMYKQRNAEGAYNVLVERHLLDDDTKFQRYFRLTPHLFHRVLSKIEPELKKEPTTWVQKPITARQKLCITLR